MCYERLRAEAYVNSSAHRALPLFCFGVSKNSQLPFLDLFFVVSMDDFQLETLYRTQYFFDKTHCFKSQFSLECNLFARAGLQAPSLLQTSVGASARERGRQESHHESQQQGGCFSRSRHSLSAAGPAGLQPGRAPAFPLQAGGGKALLSPAACYRGEWQGVLREHGTFSQGAACGCAPRCLDRKRFACTKRIATTVPADNATASRAGAGAHDRQTHSCGVCHVPESATTSGGLQGSRFRVTVSLHAAACMLQSGAADWDRVISHGSVCRHLTCQSPLMHSPQ